MSLETTTIGELNDGAPLVGTDQFVIERLGGSNFKVDADDIATFVGGGGASPLTTKGDLFTYDTADARLPVGGDGEVLTANSSEPTGLEWAAGGGGGGLETILDSVLLANSTTPVMDLSFTTVPFDGTIDYIEVDINYMQTLLGPPIYITLNNESNEEYEWSLIEQSDENGLVSDTSDFEDQIQGSSQNQINTWTHLRIRIYMGAGLGAAGPVGWFEQQGTEQLADTVYTRHGMWKFNNTAFVTTGISTIEISVPGGFFTENSSAIAYAKSTDLGPVTPLTPP